MLRLFTILQHFRSGKTHRTEEFMNHHLLQREGFIHCSTEEQLEGVMQKHFKQHENLVKLTIDPLRLTSSLRYDKDGEQQQGFPHIYGPLNLEAVTQIVFLDPISSEE